MLHAVLGGFGLAYVPEGIILPYLAKPSSGACWAIGGHRFRCPSRRQFLGGL
jgi:hypothetical protein